MSQAVFEKILKLLDDNKVAYQLYEHEPVYTSEQAAKLRGTKIEQGAKALVMVADGRPILIVISAANKVESKKFKKSFNIKDLKMATADEVKRITETEIGAVPPFGNLMGLKTFVDKSLGKNKKIVFNAGLHTRSIEMKYKDFERLVKPISGDFSAF